jgi:hypothetical protein
MILRNTEFTARVMDWLGSRFAKMGPTPFFGLAVPANILIRFITLIKK